jgi:hypothetical protein
MKSKFVFVAAIALIASGMVFAQSGSTQSTTDSQSANPAASAPQTSGHTDANDLPAAKTSDPQTDKTPPANVPNERPGAMGAPESPSTNPAQQGELPATGVKPDEKKGTTDNNEARPGTVPPTSDNSTDPSKKNMSSDPNTPSTPEYAKPITTTDSSTPSQKSTDTGTASPK